MSNKLDLRDVQGSLLKAYGRYGFPKSRYVFYRVNDGSQARKLITALLPLITNSAVWKGPEQIPDSTLNIAFTYEGLKQLGVPEKSLHSFPPEFSMGMKARRDIVGDVGVNAPACWDPIWNTDGLVQPVHMILWINGRLVERDGQQVNTVDAGYQRLCELVAKHSAGVEQLSGHVGDEGDDPSYQDGSAIYVNGMPTAKEHFGYTDGISEPYFDGCGSHSSRVIGGGKPTGGDPKTKAGWAPLATGEFVLGHRDEAGEYPAAPIPSVFAKNGTFMVYRKLHQNVATFQAYVERMSAAIPGEHAAEILSAKFVGRWKNGAPLATYPTKESADQFAAELNQARLEAKQPGAGKAAQERYEKLRLELVAFDFRDDIDGSRCPLGAHIRRVNPRGSLEFGKTGAFNTPGALINRRRIIRRGLPYGEVRDRSSDQGNHGVIIVALNASIERQFEFVQQQWINYGNDFKLGNDQDPILGNRSVNESGNDRMTIQADPRGKQPPVLCGDMPTFVETRGGDYFFVPSLTALRMMGDGIVDPT